MIKKIVVVGVVVAAAFTAAITYVHAKLIRTPFW